MLPGSFLLGAEPRPDLGEVLLSPFDPPVPGFGDPWDIPCGVVEEGVTSLASPLGRPLAGLLPRERVPDEMRNLTTLVVQELNRPGVFDFAGEDFGADECVRAPAAALDQVNAELLGRFLRLDRELRPGARGE